METLHYILTAISASSIVIAVLLFIRLRSVGKTNSLTEHRESGSPATALFNPLKLFDFEDLVGGTVPTTKLYKQAVEHVATTIAARNGDIASITAQLSSVVSNQSMLVARFSADVQAQVASGSAKIMSSKGEFLATAINRQNGQILENARLVPGPNQAAKVANVVSLVVSTAHIISGYDNAKKLSSIDKRLNLLLRRHDNALVGKLESIFETLRERLAVDSVPDRFVLLQLKTQLKELRTSWMREVECALLDIDNPNTGGSVKQWFMKVSGKEKSIKNKIEAEVSAQEISVSLIRATIFLEELISHQLGEPQTFYEMSVPSIQRHAERIEKLYIQHADYIAKLAGKTTTDVQKQALLFQVMRDSLVDEPATIKEESA